MRYLLFLCTILLVNLPAFTLYVGNPALPGIIERGFFFSPNNWFALKTGYQRDWVIDRDMKGMDNFQCTADQGVLISNITNRIEVYGSAGTIRIFASTIPTRGIRNVYQSRDQLTWGIGGRGLFAQWGKCSFGIDLKYRSAHPTLKWMTQNAVPAPSRAGAKISFREWQVGLGVSRQVSLFYPYIALKYSNARAQFKHLPLGFSPHHFKVKNHRKFGMAMGTTLSNGSFFDISLEARIIDEQALTLASQIKF